jgi:hypothetical protein
MASGSISITEMSDFRRERNQPETPHANVSQCNLEALPLRNSAVVFRPPTTPPLLMPDPLHGQYAPA